MRIEGEALQLWIDNFYGYGSWNAKAWFVAYEEGGGDLPEEVAEKLNYFSGINASGNNALCDIRELYRHINYPAGDRKAELYTNLYDYRFSSNAVQNGVWKNLIAFLYGFRREELPDLLAYQKDLFASGSAQNEALIRLYPLPSPHNHAWYYSWLDLPGFPFLKSRVAYQEHLFSIRIQHILHQLATHKPEVVLMYGMENINAIKKSVQEFFPAAKFRMVKAIKLQIPQHHRADFNGTTLLITTQIPALRHNRIETGFNWEAFGKLASNK